MAGLDKDILVFRGLIGLFRGTPERSLWAFTVSVTVLRWGLWGKKGCYCENIGLFYVGTERVRLKVSGMTHGR
jgi:hypothetical protein